VDSTPESPRMKPTILLRGWDFVRMEHLNKHSGLSYEECGADLCGADLSAC
jgi:hypothetical protein